MVSTLLRQVAFEQLIFVPVLGADDPIPVIDCCVSRTGAEGMVIFLSTGSCAVRDLPTTTQVKVCPASSFVTKTDVLRSPEMRFGDVQ